MTHPVFAAQMARLGGLKFPPTTLQTHWEGLRELEDDLVTAAVSQAQRVCVDFPTPAELRGFADFARSARPLPPEVDRSAPRETPFVIQAPQQFGGHVVATGTRAWSYYCEDCSDSGWRTYWCGTTETRRQPWLTLKACERRGHESDHEWVGPCACAGTNPDVQRKRAAHQVVTQGKRAK